MLVIVSDLHLTDGTLGETIRTGAFRIFRERLRDLAYDASWRAGGRYQPLEEFHVLLLGDILDVIRSARWLSVKVRPWDDPESPDFVRQLREITEAILQKNAASMKVLRSLSDQELMTIPPATRAGRPAKVARDPGTRTRVPVRVRVHYLVGNHDWFYHLPGASMDAIRQQIVQALGLDNSWNEPFPHDPYENDKIMALYEEHRVFARHGDIYDPFNFENDRNRSSLGDAIVVELLNRFAAEVERELGAVLPRDCREGLREIDNVRPHAIVPVWIDGLLRRTCPDSRVAKKVKEIWDRLADDFLHLPFVQKRDSPFNPLDNADKLQYILKFSRGISLSTAGRILSRIHHEWNPRSRGAYSRFALEEVAFKNRMARSIVYGHTHLHEIIPLDTSYTSEGIFPQVYLNSGTWRKVYELARRDPDQHEFIGYKVLTYLAFFKGDERRGRSFESWSGALGESRRGS